MHKYDKLRELFKVSRRDKLINHNITFYINM